MPAKSASSKTAATASKSAATKSAATKSAATKSAATKPATKSAATKSAAQKFATPKSPNRVGQKRKCVASAIPGPLSKPATKSKPIVSPSKNSSSSAAVRRKRSVTQTLEVSEDESDGYDDYDEAESDTDDDVEEDGIENDKVDDILLDDDIISISSSAEESESDADDEEEESLPILNEIEQELESLPVLQTVKALARNAPFLMLLRIVHITKANIKKPNSKGVDMYLCDANRIETKQSCSKISNWLQYDSEGRRCLLKRIVKLTLWDTTVNEVAKKLRITDKVKVYRSRGVKLYHETLQLNCNLQSLQKVE